MAEADKNNFLVSVPTEIKAKQPDENKAHNIPKMIIQTYKDNNVHPKIYENIQDILNLNPDYSYTFITDDIGRDLIKTHFDKNVLDAYDVLNAGAAKADLLRLVAIYIYGGVYIDLDSTIVIELNKFIDNDRDFYFIWDGGPNLMNTPLISKPKNPIIMLSLIHI